MSDVSQRKMLVRFRLGVSVLRIETGRWEHNGLPGAGGIPIEWRVCLCCSDGKVEDEIHFFAECPVYESLRQSMFNRVVISEKLPYYFFNGMPSHAVFSFLLGSQSKRVIQAVAQFVWDSFRVRSDILKALPANA